MKNLDLRKSAKAAGIPLWRIADAIGVGEATMTRKLRHELPEKEKQQMFGSSSSLQRRQKRTMRSIEHTPSVNPPFQKIEDAVRTTGFSSFFLRKGCRDGSIPCVRSGRTIYVNVAKLLQQYGAANRAD